MARPAFKRWFTRLVPASRRAQHLCAALQPRADRCCSGSGSRSAVSSGRSTDPIGRAVLLSAASPLAGCWCWCPRSSSTTSTSSACARSGCTDAAGPTRARVPHAGLYRLVRHPLYVGWLFAFWATPTMTISHLVFAIATTGYILIAIQLEERDLVAHHGAGVRGLPDRVPMLIPFTRKRKLDDPFMRRQRS